MTVPTTAEIATTYQDAAHELLAAACSAAADYKAYLRAMLLARGRDQEELARIARQTRDAMDESTIVVRASLEFSNICRQKCSFCGMTARNKDLTRYRMTASQMDAVVNNVAAIGVREMHLASGEDWGFAANDLSDVIRKAVNAAMELTLVTSQRKLVSDYKLWKEAGASRYILKVETTSPALFKAARTGTHLPTRVSHLLYLRDMGSHMSGN